MLGIYRLEEKDDKFIDLFYNYTVRRNINSDFFIVLMLRVAILFLELEVVQKFIQQV